MSTGDRPLVAKGSRFSNSKQLSKIPYFVEVSICFFKIIFCLTSWFMLKQLNNSLLLFMSDSQLDCASLTTVSTHKQLKIVVYEIVKYRSTVVIQNKQLPLDYKSKYKRLVYCQYRKWSLASIPVGPLSERNTKWWTVFLSDNWACTRNIKLHFLYRQHINFLYFDLYLNTAYAAHYVYSPLDYSFGHCRYAN